MEHVTKWATVVEYVDIETGEIIKKAEYEKDYYKVRNNKSTEIKEVIINNEKLRYGYRKWTTECRKKPKQFGLF